MKKRVIAVFLIIAMLFTNISIPVEAASAPTSYYLNGTKYKLNKRTVTYNGTTISLTSTPALEMNGYNYVPYNYVFVKNGPKVGRVYDSSTKKITLTSTVDGNQNVLVMTVGKKAATLNGVSVTLPCAPVNIKLKKNGSNIVYVPAKAVGPLLGLDYSYTSSTKTIKFTSGLSLKQNGEYSVYTRTKVAVNVNGTTVSSPIPGIIEGNTTLIPAAIVYDTQYKTGVRYTYSSGVATISYGGNKVVLTKNSTTALVNNVKKTMAVPMRLITLVSTGKSYAMIPGQFVTEALGMKYKYSSGVSYISFASTSSSTQNSFDPTITLKKTDDMGTGNLVCTDDYLNKRLVLTMTGDQTTFYEENPITLPSDVTAAITYDAQTDQTKVTLTTKTINGFKVQEDEKYIYILNGTPKEMFQNVIVLDPGHGGADTGIVGNGYKEKDFNLAIALAAKSCFESNGDYKVYCTRLDDSYPSLASRYTLANEVEADIFVSVHIGSDTSTSATGTATLYNPDRNNASGSGLSSYQLALYTQKLVQAGTGFKNLGLKECCARLANGLALLNFSKNATVISEIGHLTNPSEASSMATNLEQYGKAIYDAVCNTSTEYPTNRSNAVIVPPVQEEEPTPEEDTTTEEGTTTEEDTTTEESMTIEESTTTEESVTTEENAPTEENLTTEENATTEESVNMDTTNPANVEKQDWREDGVLKVLSIGNSFSVDCHAYLYQVLENMGVEKIVIGNLHVSSSALQTHLNNLRNGKNSYTLYLNTTGVIENAGKYSIKKAIDSDNWDFITLQQNSLNVGMADTYDDIHEIIHSVSELKPTAKLVWHMTWAMQGDNAEELFSYYDYNQDYMYQSIAAAVKNQIAVNPKVDLLIPTGTAIQNARTSYLGDTLCRDKRHLSYTIGRYIGAVAFAYALTGSDQSALTYYPDEVSAEVGKIAVESAKNAIANPYSVTTSKYSNTYKANYYKNNSTETCIFTGGAHNEKETLTQATKDADGKLEVYCKRCDTIVRTTTYKKASTIKLSKSSYVYDGTEKTPTVTVKNSSGTSLVEGTDYTISYGSGRTNPGSYSVTVTLKGNYKGTYTLSFQIKPQPTSLTKLTAKKAKLTVKWNKMTTKITGYEIQYSISKKFTSKTTKTVRKTKKYGTVQLKKLTSKKRYYVRIRTYKTVNGTRYYSAWSKVMNKKTL